MLVTEEIEAPTTMIVDGLFMVQSLKPGTSNDFCEYVDNVIVPFVNNILRRHKRVDVTLDRYFPSVYQKSYPH